MKFYLLFQDCKPKAGTYSVFGAGMRYCPGNNLARHQLMMFIYHACLKYKYTNLLGDILIMFCCSSLELNRIICRWELLNPEAGIVFQPHQRPRDGAEMLFSQAD